MRRNDQPGGPIRAFFETAEGEKLYRNCPFRPHPSQLHELEEATVNNILAHMLGHIIDYKAGRPGRTESEIPAIDQANINPELRYVYNDCNNIELNEERRINPATSSDDRLEYGGYGPEDEGGYGDSALNLQSSGAAPGAHDRSDGRRTQPRPSLALRAVTSVDGMTAEFFPFDMGFLGGRRRAYATR
jgi:hypothetical protein